MRTESREVREMIRPLGKCQRDQCQAESTIRLVEVIDAQGQRQRGAASEFADGWVLRQPYILAGWYERCSYCYSVERLREEAGRWRREGKVYPVNWGLPQFRAIRCRDDFARAFPDFLKFIPPAKNEEAA